MDKAEAYISGSVNQYRIRVVEPEGGESLFIIKGTQLTDGKPLSLKFPEQRLGENEQLNMRLFESDKAIIFRADTGFRLKPEPQAQMDALDRKPDRKNGEGFEIINTPGNFERAPSTVPNVAFVTMQLKPGLNSLQIAHGNHIHFNVQR